MSKRSNSNSKHERFMASMTFSSMFGNCDCDECEGENSTVPPDISAAVKDYKRLRITSASQERILTFRNVQGGISIWEIVMPPGAEPLMELGGSHRFVLVTQLPKNRTVKIIGSGIVGSSSEEQSRREMKWSERSAYFYPSDAGKRIGWTNDRKRGDGVGLQEPQENDKKDVLEGSADIIHDVVVYVIKATQDALKKNGQETFASNDKKDILTEQTIKIFQKYSKDPDIQPGIEISPDDADKLRSIIDDIIASKV